MRNWKKLEYTNTFREMVDLFNVNRDNSEFIDGMVGSILSNGVLFEGNETINGRLISPLTKVDVSGEVQSNTILDNFTLYYRDTNHLITLNKFPVDLLSYANGKLQFFYIKEDLSYRISDYMFGAADEILLFRFVINTDSTWNQLYIMAQRAGTPMYNAGDEFYTIDGLFVKSPSGLNLSQTSGTVKRSGIEFTDKISPDIVQFYNLSLDRMPLRYINNMNEVDYTKDVTYNIITNKYLEYNENKKLKIEAEQTIRNIQNMYYETEKYSNEIADELHGAILAGGEYSDLKQIVDSYISYIDKIYSEVDNLYNLLGNKVLSSVRRAALLENKTLIMNYINTNLRNQESITDIQTTAIRNVPAYIVNINLTICPTPLDNCLQEIQDGLNEITFAAGTFKDVPAGKFTIQRILWDIYENSLIIQYGDKVYDSLDAAVDGTDLVEYPAPFGKTIYIPMAILILKSGITSINDDPETVLIDRRWINVDEQMTEYADYISRAKADKALQQIYDILNGNTPVPKSDSLKCTIDGKTNYKDGDYYLNYDNLNNKMTTVNNLTTSTYNSKQALAASQGYVLDQKKLNLSGGTLTGNLNSRTILPSANNSYNLGGSSNYWNNGYINALYTNNATVGNLTITGTLTSNNSGRYVSSPGNSVLYVKAMAKSSYNNGNNSNGTVTFCW